MASTTVEVKIKARRIGLVSILLKLIGVLAHVLPMRLAAPLIQWSVNLVRIDLSFDGKHWKAMEGPYFNVHWEQR